MSEQRVRWLEEYCHVCGRQLNSWDAQVSKALGYKHKLCERCVADEYTVVPQQFYPIFRSIRQELLWEV